MMIKMRIVLAGLQAAPALLSTLALLHPIRGGSISSSSARRHCERSGRSTTTMMILVLQIVMWILGPLLVANGAGAARGLNSMARSDLAANGDGSMQRQQAAAAASSLSTSNQRSSVMWRSVTASEPTKAMGSAGRRRDSFESHEFGPFEPDDGDDGDRDSADSSVGETDDDYLCYRLENDDITHEEAGVESAYDIEEEPILGEHLHKTPRESPVGFSSDGFESGATSDEEYDTDESDYADATDDPHEDDSEDDDAIDLGGRGDLLPEGSPQREGSVDEVQVGKPDSVRVCIVTWNLAEGSPPARDVEFVRRASHGSDLVAVGVQEIENLKPRRHEGSRTREWRRLLIRTLGKDFIRVGHHAMGAVQLTVFARREMFDRVKVIKLTEVACGVGNVLQNKGGIGAYMRVDRTTFLFVAAHLAAHQARAEERNANYWRIATTLDQEIPPAWVTHAARKRAKRARLEIAAATNDAAAADDAAGGKHGSGVVVSGRSTPPPTMTLPPRGPFEDRVDRVFFFGDLNYRVNLSREDLEIGLAADRRLAGGLMGARRLREQTSLTSLSSAQDVTYPGIGALDHLLDFDQLTFARSRGDAFGGFSEARVTFPPTYKFDKISSRYDTSRKMRPPAWTDRILYSPAGPRGVSSLEYASVPGSRHSDHRPVYASFRVHLEGDS